MGKPKQETFGNATAAQRRTCERKLFLENITFAESGCILWIGPLKGAGQPVFRLHDGRNVRARRWLWVDSMGPCPKGHQVKNACGNPLCVSPDCSFLTGREDA